MAYFHNTLTGTGIQPFSGQGGTGVLFNRAVFFPIRSFTAGIPTYNSGSMYIGFTSAALPIVMSTGTAFNWEMEPRALEDIKNFWFKGTSGDGAYVVTYRST